MATIIQNFATAHPALCGTINHGSKERGNIRMMNRPFKPEFCTGRLDERWREKKKERERDEVLESGLFPDKN